MSKKTQKPNSMNLTFKGTTYKCVLKNGKVTVRAPRTAKGQTLVSGVYDTVTKRWHNDNGDGTLPNVIKQQVQTFYDC